MRILYIAPPGAASNAFGGIETYARDLCEGIRSRGHVVDVLICDPAALLANLTAFDRIPRWALRQRYYFWRAFFLQDFRYHNALARVTRDAVRRSQPELIHALHTYQSAAVAAAGPIPSVVSCYGLEIEDTPPVRSSLQEASAVHCDSDFAQGLVRDVVGPRSNLFTLTWGIRDREPPRVEGASLDFELVTVSRLVPRKNVETVLRALSHLGDSRIRYAVVGDGPELGRLQVLASELGLTNVRFLGALSDHDKRDVLRRSRLFVMCPRSDLEHDVEGLGLVYFEAHGLGLACIGARSGGVPEAIGDAGVLIRNPLDHVELAEAIRDALRPETYERLRDAVVARQHSHSWEAFMAAWERKYADLITARLDAPRREDARRAPR
jgi:glycosyltransferase involved in cell wall biosynthesis